MCARRWIPVRAVRTEAGCSRVPCVMYINRHNKVEVILTAPYGASRLEDALRACGYQAAFLERTAETFGNLAVCAVVRFLVMTPFVDDRDV